MASWAEGQAAVGDRSAIAARFLEIPASVRSAHARDEGRMDPLTGLSNRRHLQAMLERRLRRAAPDSVAVVFLDVDRLKVVNDTFGHESGDRVLRAVGGRLRGFATEFDVIVRLGGDEFAMCVADIPSVQAIKDVCTRVLESISRPITIGGHELSLTASVGIAVNGRITTVADVLRRADEAMYEAKRSGRNQACVYTQPRSGGASGVELSLRDLSQASGIETRFQVIVDADGEVRAVEALARWRQGTELLMADEFVPLAERSGSMAAVTRAVLRQALSLAKDLPDSVRLHVNISQTMLGDRRLAGLVSGACDDAGICPQRLCLEVTETAFSSDAAAMALQLRELRALGCAVAIDDFGTGYGSLTLIRDVSVDIVKVDKSFVDEVAHSASAQAIVSAVVMLSRGIGASVVAEGVDDEAKRTMLFELGCDAVQGHHLGQPESADEITVRLAGRRPRRRGPS